VRPNTEATYLIRVDFPEPIGPTTHTGEELETWSAMSLTLRMKDGTGTTSSDKVCSVLFRFESFVLTISPPTEVKQLASSRTTTSTGKKSRFLKADNC